MSPETQKQASSQANETEFAYYKYRLALVEELRQNLDQIKLSLDATRDSETLKNAGVFFAKECFEKCIEVYDCLIMAGVLEQKYKLAIKMIRNILFFTIITNVFTASIVWLLTH